jgi:copper(I)-binding protein
MKEYSMKNLLMGTFLTSLALVAHAQISVSDPWVRATVPAQKATGAFMKLTSASDARLVAARSPIAGIVEIHEMSMEGNVMRMRALPHGLDLPAGKPVELKAGGYHFMLMDLKHPLKAGDTVPISLVIEDKQSKRTVVEIKAPVRPLGQ